MEADLKIVEALARGNNPVTGEKLAEQSIYNHPDVIRALFTLLEQVRGASKPKKSLEEKQADNLARGLPLNAGFPWTDEQRTELASQYTIGKTMTELARLHQRTHGAIRSELKRQGLIEE